MRSWRSILALLSGMLLTACGAAPQMNIDTAQAAPAAVSEPAPTAQAAPSPAVTAAVSPPTQASGLEQAPAGCPITRPQEPQFVPPAPHKPRVNNAVDFWYGSDELWTRLYHDGTWRDLPVTEGSYGNKVAFWRRGYVWTEEPSPKLTLSARSLDDPALAVDGERANNAFHPDEHSFIMTGINLPAPGCWELSATYREHSLSFVVWVEPSL